MWLCVDDKVEPAMMSRRSVSTGVYREAESRR